MGESGVLQDMEGTLGEAMITKIADNIISPLGSTSEENFKAVLSGKSMLYKHEGKFCIPDLFCASLFDRAMLESIFEEEIGKDNDLTFFERFCILSAKKAITSCNLSPNESNVIFILSTTKGNVDCLESSLMDIRCYLAESALKIAKYFGNDNMPLVVSNACISGVCAQIAAVRELLSGKYRYAVVIGCDILSKFVISGFQSFKALSDEQCKPFDKDRVGLNLGEAVGTIILKAGIPTNNDDWQYVTSSIHNDANHISGPSRTGEGSFRVLDDILGKVDVEEIGFINVHGTSTVYNDDMESIAIHRANLDMVPVNGLKGYYGHTLGAAGIIETILSMKAIEGRVVLATKGFETPGTTYPVNISNKTRTTEKSLFIKILSGFGGSNAGIVYRKGAEA